MDGLVFVSSWRSPISQAKLQVKVNNCKAFQPSSFFAVFNEETPPGSERSGFQSEESRSGESGTTATQLPMILCTLHPIKTYPDKCQIRLRPSKYVFSDEPGQSRPAGGALLQRSTSIVNIVNSNLLVGFDAQFPFDSEDFNCLWQKKK